ncbi:MAG: uracil-DNA glycosylase [Candidatus Kerfeldbacteria bacterium CG_4_10_14_0_8_um_filter_42_10]|uniref:Type-4 uracil-DNA glycosylase n=1 Tax=Candidatus Kerfeldbacteria bacterium CG_4_10_14_0_8_um_filter_42_10 TaxID=2014248 RepID=A0A2M7RJ22_9BACT|nr:MAG: uracil-DNA glycosylase [Candidatus Kerfeldbacteria bacterium CG_4_10_14_0_8_um_filter_42_10]
MDNLETISQEISRCQKCVLAEKRTNAVPGDGNSNAEIMFIGEGPGEQEDLQGKPFVGQAGKFLEEMLETIGLKRKDVFITNLVKCRPPSNRDPFPDEIEVCVKNYLERQIKLIKPRLIITLGRHAMERFIPGRKISQIHGQPKRLVNHETGEKQIYLPLYHPAAALYHGSLRETLIRDFKKIPKILEKVNQLK